MKILNKQQFYALPAGALFSLYSPCIIQGLMIKGETIGDNGPIDFWYRDLIGNVKSQGSADYMERLMEAEATGSSFDLEFDCEQRDGLYEDNALYAVYSRQDINELSETIKTCVGHD